MSAKSTNTLKVILKIIVAVATAVLGVFGAGAAGGGND